MKPSWILTVGSAWVVVACLAPVTALAQSGPTADLPPVAPIPESPAGPLTNPTIGGPSGSFTPLGPALNPPSGVDGASVPAGSDVGKTVMDVRVEGNKRTAMSKVMSYLRTRKGRPFDSEIVQGDTRRLIQSGLFRDVRTLTLPQADGVVVLFQVFERPTVEYVKFIGNRGMRDKELLKQSDLKVGDALNQFNVEEGRRKIEQHYHTKGFPKAEVSIMEGDKPTDGGIVYLVNEGQLERISSVDFVGNSIASDDRLKTQIESKPGFLWYFFGGKVDRKKIDDDIEKLTAYYRSLGFFRARIGRELNFDDSGRWLKLTFVIDEGPRYTIRNVSVIGNQKFSSDSLLGQVEMKSGEYFNQAKMNRDLTTLRDAYGSQGHIFADIQADPRFLEDPGQLDLVYRVQEGEVFRVGEIHVKIDGDYPHTRENVVRNRISLRPGDILDVRELRRSEQRIKASQLFETDPSRGSPPQLVVIPPDLKDLETSVAERPKPRAGSSSYRGQNPE